MKGASGAPIPVLGTSCMKLKFNNMKITNKFFIVSDEILPVDVILGMDYLNKTKCIITTNPLSVKMNGQQVEVLENPRSISSTQMTHYIENIRTTNEETSLPQAQEEEEGDYKCVNKTKKSLQPNAMGAITVTVKTKNPKVLEGETCLFIPKEDDPIAMQVQGGICKIDYANNIATITVPYINNTSSKIKIPNKHEIGTIEMISEVEQNSVNMVQEYPKDSPNIRLSKLEKEVDNMFPPGTIYNQELKKLVNKFPDIFQLPNEPLHISKCFKYKINMKSNQPTFTKQYPIPMSVEQGLEKEIEKMLANNLIQPSVSSWNSPIMVVLKKDGAIRIVQDLRKINLDILSCNFPLPRIDNIFQSLRNSKIFSTLDLVGAYHQIQLDEDSMPITAFTIPHMGRFEYRVLPQGLSASPSAFQRIIHSVLAGLLSDVSKVFIDDILVTAPTIEQHVVNLEKVFERLQKADLVIKLSKCQFFKSEVDFLGHTINGEGIRPQESKVKAIKNYEKPKTVKNLQAFLGVCNYYRKMIRNFSLISAPLTTLTKGGNIKGKRSSPPIIWNKKAEEAFEELKKRLTSDIILHYPDYSKPFLLYTDSSGIATGGCLMQSSDQNILRPILYFSKKLTPTQQNWTVSEQELLAILQGLRASRNIVLGFQTIILSDHKPLTWLFGLKSQSGKLARIAIELASYNIVVKHVKGKDNIVADFLSRIKKTDDIEDEEIIVHYIADSCQVITNKKVHDLDILSLLDNIETLMSINTSKTSPLSEDLGKYQGKDSLISEETGCTRRLFSEESAELRRQGNLTPGSNVWVVDETSWKPVSDGKRTRRFNEGHDDTADCHEPSPDKGIDPCSFYAGPRQVKNMCPNLEVKNGNLVLSVNHNIAAKVVLTNNGDVYTQYSIATQGEDSPVLNIEEIKQEQLKDETCVLLEKLITQKISGKEEKKLKNLFRLHTVYNFKSINGVIYNEKNNNGRLVYQAYIPQPLRLMALRLAHDAEISGHGGVQRTMKNLQAFAFWPSMSKDVTKHCLTCEICIQFKGKYGPKAPVLRFNETSRPNELLFVDLIGPIEKSIEGYNYILACIDARTRFLVTIPLRDKTTTKVAKALVTNYIAHHGIPTTIISDQGGEFNSVLMTEISRLLNFRHYFTPSYHPSSNGVIERCNSTAIKILKTLVVDNPKLWATMLPYVMLAYNTSYHSSIQESPYFLKYLTDPTYPWEILNGEVSKTVDLADYKETLMTLQRKAYDRTQLFLDRDYNILEEKNQRKKIPELKVGARVYISKPPVAGEGPNKLKPLFYGPYRLMEKRGQTTLVVKKSKNKYPT